MMNTRPEDLTLPSRGVRTHSDQGENRRREIIEKARELFARHGYRRCTTEDISRECNLTKAALYHYFDNKEDLFAEVISFEAEALLEELKNVVASDVDPVAKLTAYIRTRFGRMQTLANLYGLTSGGSRMVRQLPHVAIAYTRFAEDEVRLLTTLFDEGIEAQVFRSIDRESLIRILLASAKGVLFEFVLEEQPFDINNAINEIVELMCYGLVLR